MELVLKSNFMILLGRGTFFLPGSTFKEWCNKIKC